MFTLTLRRALSPHPGLRSPPAASPYFIRGIAFRFSNFAFVKQVVPPIPRRILQAATATTVDELKFRRLKSVPLTQILCAAAGRQDFAIPGRLFSSIQDSMTAAIRGAARPSP